MERKDTAEEAIIYRLQLNSTMDEKKIPRKYPLALNQKSAINWKLIEPFGE